MEDTHTTENLLIPPIYHCLPSDFLNLGFLIRICSSTSSLLGEGVARMLELGSVPNAATVAEGFSIGDDMPLSTYKLYSRQRLITTYNRPVPPEFSYCHLQQASIPRVQFLGEKARMWVHLSIFSTKTLQTIIKCDERMSQCFIEWIEYYIERILLCPSECQTFLFSWNNIPIERPMKCLPTNT